MYYVSKRMEIAGAHQLALDYPSKCINLHGHNWIVTVHCRAKVLDRNGMVADFTLIKKYVHDKLDHQFINDILPGINPTAENMARWICETVNKKCFAARQYTDEACCYKVEVQESEGNVATYVCE